MIDTYSHNQLLILTSCFKSLLVCKHILEYKEYFNKRRHNIPNQHLDVYPGRNPKCQKSKNV